jgi:hypothetical protein
LITTKNKKTSVKSLQSRLGRSLDGMVGVLYFHIVLKSSRISAGSGSAATLIGSVAD